MTTKHTPGPWRWELNAKHHGLELCGGRPRYDLTVLDFKRWGMSSAIARFRTDAHGPNTMQKATDFARPIPGREHHSSWLQAVDHPDAHLIAAAPDLLAACEMWLSGETMWSTTQAYEMAARAVAKAKGDDSGKT